MAQITIAVEGLKNYRQYLDALPEATKTAAMRAINDVAGKSALVLLRRDMQAQVNWPAGYLDDPDRFGLDQAATKDNLTAVVVGRQRATSLARFAQPGVGMGQRLPAINVSVRPGTTKAIPRAFLVRLRAGPTITNDYYNVGLALRLKPGERPRNTHDWSYKQIFPNVYLLYGPSVDQVFREVADQDSEAIADLLETQFVRQMALALDGM